MSIAALQQSDVKTYILITLKNSKIPIPALVDTGNLCALDLLDHSLFEKLYEDSKDKPELITLQDRRLEAIGGAQLDDEVCGQVHLSYQFEELKETWKGRPVVVKNLGFPMIISAKTIAKLPLIPDLKNACAYLGSLGTRIPLYGLEEAWKKTPSTKPLHVNTEGEESESVIATLGPEDSNNRARLVGVVCIPGHSGRTVRIKNVTDKCMVYLGGSASLSRRKIEGVDGVLNRNNDNTSTITLINPTPHDRFLHDSCDLGRLIPVEGLTSASTSTRCGSTKKGGHHSDSASPRLPKVGKTPDFSGLDTEKDTDCQKILDIVYQWLGPPPQHSRDEKKRIRKDLNEKLGKQIQENELLTNNQKKLLFNLFYRFHGTIAQSNFDSGTTDLLEFSIDTGDSSPISQKVRPMNPLCKDEFGISMKELLDEKLLLPGSGPWGSPIVPSLKQDGSWRFCVDYRRLNDVTKSNLFPVANTISNVHCSNLRNAKYFASLDLAAGYYAIPVAKDSRAKLAWATNLGLFEPTRMPFGPKTACAVYAQLMGMVFGDMVKDQKLLNYFDDSLIYGSSFIELFSNLAEFLERVECSNLRIRTKKCVVFSDEAEWLGHTIKAGQYISLQDRLIEKIKDWPNPSESKGAEVKNLMSFLGLSSYYRKFIRGFASIAEPLTKLLKKENEFHWGKEQEIAFNTIKSKLISKPVLAYPNYDRDWYIDVDASGGCIGGVLQQMDSDGQLHPIAYGSKVLNKQQRNYSTYRKELLAIVTFVTSEWSYFLMGGNVIVRTDHSSLRWLLTSKNVYGQLLRWAEALQAYNVQINYRAGTKHTNADSMSRYPHPNEEEEPMSLTEDDKYHYELLGVPLPKSGPVARAGAVTRRSARLATKSKESNPDEVEALEQSKEAAKTGEKPYPIEALTVQDAHVVPSEADNKEELPACFCEKPVGVEMTEQYMTVNDEVAGRDWSELDDNEHADAQRRSLKQRLDMEKEQLKDPIIKEIRDYVKRGSAPELKLITDPVTRQYIKNFKHLLLKDGKLYYKPSDRFRIVIPEHLTGDLLRILHHHPLAGHCGEVRTWKQYQLHFYFPGASKLISDVISGCSSCRKAKMKSITKNVPLGQTSSSAGERFANFAADIVGPWPSGGGPHPKRYLVTFQDLSTKYPEAYVVSTITAEKITQILLQEFIPRYGSGFTLRTDQGKQFTSAIFRHVSRRLGLFNVLTQAYAPMTNPVERLHRTLEGTIRSLMEQEDAHPFQWYRYVPFALAAMRQTPLSGTSVSPHFLVHAAHPKIPAQVYLNEDINDSTELGKGVRVLEKVYDKMNKDALQVHLRNKAYYDKKVKHEELKINDWVFKHTPDLSESGMSKKTAVYQTGPYRVIDIPNDRMITIVKQLEKKKGEIQGVRETLSRDRLSKTSLYEIGKLPTPLSIGKITKKLKVKALPTIYEEKEPEKNEVIQPVYISSGYFADPPDPPQRRPAQETADLPSSPAQQQMTPRQNPLQHSHTVAMEEPDSEELVDTLDKSDSTNMVTVEQPSIPSYLFRDGEEGHDSNIGVEMAEEADEEPMVEHSTPVKIIPEPDSEPTKTPARVPSQPVYSGPATRTRSKREREPTLSPQSPPSLAQQRVQPKPAKAARRIGDKDDPLPEPSSPAQSPIQRIAKSFLKK